MAHASLRYLLYSHYKLEDGNNVFWEIHQQGLLADVDIVRPSVDEAEHLVGEMNKNMAAFLTFDLTSGEAPYSPTFVKELVEGCFDSTLVAEIPKCTWDAEKRALRTPRCEALEAAKRQEEAEWYVKVESLQISGKGKKKKGQANRNNLLRFNDDSSFTTLNVTEGDGAGGKGYGGDAGMPVFSLGKARAAAKPPERGGNKKAEEEEDGVSALTGTSGVSSSRREVATLQQQLAEAEAKIKALKALSVPCSTAGRQEPGSSTVESLAASSSSSSDSSSSSSSSSAPTSLGSKAAGPSMDAAA